MAFQNLTSFQLIINSYDSKVKIHFQTLSYLPSQLILITWQHLLWLYAADSGGSLSPEFWEFCLKKLLENWQLDC